MRFHMPSLRHDEDKAQAPLASDGDKQHPLPPTPANWPVPKLRLVSKDLSDAGSALFYDNIQPTVVLRDAVLSVLKTLYTLQSCPRK